MSQVFIVFCSGFFESDGVTTDVRCTTLFVKCLWSSVPSKVCACARAHK